ncbi:penicillin-binding protein 2 [Candidatus Uhrbacteria bacterium]|nr:penicillin-binding protein 2 [Candidatus Uhrbacteria bacterium]
MPDLHATDPIVTIPAAADEHRSEFIGRSVAPIRMLVAFCVLATVPALLLARAFFLQIIRGDAYATIAEQNRTRRELALPTRGIMLDRHGTPLVHNVLRYGIGIVPLDLPRGSARGDALRAMATVLRIPSESLTELLSRYPTDLGEPVPVMHGLTYADAIAPFVRSRDLPAVRIMTEQQRTYVGADGREVESLSHVIGFVGHLTPADYRALASHRYQPNDVIGKSGGEAAWESSLRGSTGVRTLTIDARGRLVATTSVEAAVAGSSVRTTIDRPLQLAAEDALRRVLARSGKRRGAVVLLDPAQGEILALVSLPAFSATAMSQGISASAYAALTQSTDHPLFARAISGAYPPGSTVKPFYAAMALARGIVTPQSRIMSTGGFRVGASVFPDWRPGGHGSVRVFEAIAQSVNTYFYVIGGGWPNVAMGSAHAFLRQPPLGPDGLAAALRVFGFGQPTGIDIDGEYAGLVPTPEWRQRIRQSPWYIGDTYHLAIGQGDLLVTPLQLARATAVFANGGHRITPHLRREETPGAAIALPDIDPEVISVLRDALRQTVTSGSGRALLDMPVRVSGKTGTAQTDRARAPHAWFTGYAEQQSRSGEARAVVITVLVEEGGEGSATAVPVAEEILRVWAHGVDSGAT